MNKKMKKQFMERINKLIADNDWENVQAERDKFNVSKIKSLNSRSNADVLIGAVSFFGAYSYFLDIFKIFSKNVDKLVALEKETGVPQELDIHTALNGIKAPDFWMIIILIVLGIMFMVLAMLKNEKSDTLGKARYVWMPDDDEVNYIEKRFDNTFVKNILSKISSTDTNTIEVGLDAVTVNNNTGPIVFNYNNYGYKRLSNYDTKQLAYHLASHSFPEGFAIYQTKIALIGIDKFIGGTTDVGSEEPSAAPALKNLKRMFSRLFAQIEYLLHIQNPFEEEEEDAGPSTTYNGQIVVNKGFVPDKEDYKDL